MKSVLDIHTHTLASGHAYSTIRENAVAASGKGLELLAITEHAPRMPGTCKAIYFQNLKVIDRYAYGVELLMGAELNILDPDGTVDLPEKVLKQLDICIASLHILCMKPAGRDENTCAYVNAIKNPYVDILGHPDDGRYPLDYEKIVLAAKESGVLLELNNSSLRPESSRQNTRVNDEIMLRLCIEHKVPIAIGSDAHVDLDVGNHKLALALLEELRFPEELVINRSAEALKNFLNGRRQREGIR